MSKYAIQVEGLGKEYLIGGAEQRHDSFREMLTGALVTPFRKLRKLGGTASEEERFWALKEISFNVEQGEVLGIIGRNGAGKSTLLKILSRITSPTAGRAITKGRVASLLEVGTGFHPELTGRENIYLNGSILGMSRIEINRKLDEIVDFAGLDLFLDTPVKRYSSGMSVRLGFSVAAHLEQEILLVDEVLAVGDSAFQRKCLGKLDSIARKGRTVLFVSHNMSMIQNLCARGLLLGKGGLLLDGSVDAVIGRYTDNIQTGSDEEFGWGVNRPGNGWIRMTRFDCKMNGKGTKVLQTAKNVRFCIGYQLNREIDVAGFRIDIKTIFGEHVLCLGTDFSDTSIRLQRSAGVVSCNLEKLPLMPGTYTVAIYCGANGQLSDHVENASNFDVIEGDFYGGGKLPPANKSFHVLVEHDWQSE